MLVRRLYLDLIGLPPTPAQLDAFVADARAEAWDALVDELLASPGGIIVVAVASDRWRQR